MDELNIGTDHLTSVLKSVTYEKSYDAWATDKQIVPKAVERPKEQAQQYQDAFNYATGKEINAVVVMAAALGALSVSALCYVYVVPVLATYLATTALSVLTVVSVGLSAIIGAVFRGKAVGFSFYGCMERDAVTLEEDFVSACGYFSRACTLAINIVYYHGMIIHLLASFLIVSS